MHYSIKPTDREYVKGYGFFSFPKNVGACATKAAKNLILISISIVKSFLIVLKNLQQMQ